MTGGGLNVTGFDVAPLVIGNVSRGNIASRLSVYSAVVEAAFGGSQKIEFVGQTDVSAKALTPAGLDQATNAFSRELIAALDSRLRPDVLTLLDLTGLAEARGVSQTEAATAISESTAGGEGPLLVLVDAYPPEHDALANVVALRGDSVLLVSTDGRTSRADAAGRINVAVAAAMQRLVEAPIDRLQRKVLRVPGWFDRTYGGERVFGRNWYDGEFCQTEIVEILLSEIDPERIDVVVITPDFSRWLHGPAAAVTVQLELPPVCRVGEFAQRFTDLRESIGRTLRVALLTPLVDSGASLTQAHAELMETGLVERIESLAILSTKGRVKPSGVRRIEASGIEYRYLVTVRRDTVSAVDDDCLPITLGVPVTTYEPGRRELSVYEFWDLVELCGTRDEDNVPPYRASVGTVPDIEGIIGRYGAWVASRLMNLAKGEARTEADQLLFVCPQEPNSESIADYLQDLYDVSIVRVPRSKWLTGTDWTDEKLHEELDACADEGWIQQLKQASWADCVLLDEFTSSGETLSQLNRVVTALGLKPLFWLVIVDMRPRSALTPVERVNRPKVRSLYSLRTDEGGVV